MHLSVIDPHHSAAEPLLDHMMQHDNTPDIDMNVWFDQAETPWIAMTLRVG
jgi:hypothetical protein